MIYIGIDNGVTGSIGIIARDKAFFFFAPVKKEQSYTKKKQMITRIDHQALCVRLSHCGNAKVFLERPMINPTRFKATMSALRALESTLIVIETLKLSHEYIDSKEWQKVMLPKGIKGATELKKASLDIGCRLFPQYKELIRKREDADGLLIAEYCRRTKR